MKVILREYGGEHFVVKEVERKQDGSYKIVDCNRVIRENEILTVIDNEKCKKVVCSGCGEIIPNTKKAIENHRNAHKTYEGCMNCANLKFSSNDSGKVKYTLNEDGTFSRSLKDNGNLRCGRSYSNYKITESRRSEVCKYAYCANAEFEELKTFFDKYPGAFNDMITIDAIKDFRYVSEGTYTRVELKARGSIYAYVNKKGIIEWFRVETRYDTHDFYYSKKYDKFFLRSGWTYSEITRAPSWNMSNDRWNYIKETVRKLYN